MRCGEMGVAIDDSFIKVTGYRPHRHAALCSYPAENVLWAAGEELLFDILFFSYNFDFSGEISIQSGQQRNLYRLLEGLTRAFCYISYSFQDTPFQAFKTEILGVRPRRFSNFFNNQNDYSKSSRQSLGSVCVVSILGRQVLQMHTTLKSLRQKFELYTCYISAPV